METEMMSTQKEETMTKVQVNNEIYYYKVSSKLV